MDYSQDKSREKQPISRSRFGSTPATPVVATGGSGDDLHRLPVVDIAPLYGTNDAARHAAANRLGMLAHRIGFLYITGYRIEERTADGALRAARHFFAQSPTFKSGYFIGGSTNHRGYVPTTERGDYDDETERRYEAYDLSLDLPSSDPDYLAGNPLAGPNRWPDIVGFRQAVGHYFDELLALGYLLAAAFEAHLGLPRGWFGSQMSKPVSQLRLIHYLENPDAGAGGNNMGAHTDYEGFTILRPFAPGLQVLNPAGRWIDVPPIPGTMVINIGDMMETWTGGYFRSTLHRVVNNGRERYSMPFFMAADYDALIRPAPGFESDCPRHRPFVAGDHLLRMLMRDFPYLRRRYRDAWMTAAAGEVTIRNPFEDRRENAPSATSANRDVRVTTPRVVSNIR